MTAQKKLLKMQDWIEMTNKLTNFRDLESLSNTPVRLASTPKQAESVKPKVVHYDVQRKTIKDRIAELLDIKQPMLDIVYCLKKEYRDVCKIEPSYVRMHIATIGMTKTNGDWRPFYVSQEDFTKA